MSERKLPDWYSLPTGSRPAGYSRMIHDHALQVLPRTRLTFISEKAVRREEHVDGRTQVILPPQYNPGDGLGEQLEFALKHEGVDLEVLSALFRALPRAPLERQLTRWIRARPTGQYARKLWFLYELLSGRRLALRDAHTGNYVELLDPEVYYTGTELRSRRHRVIDNLLGNAEFCPVVRRTKMLVELESKELQRQAKELVGKYDEDTLRRAVGYLFTKETRSSFQIEGENPDSSRTMRFVGMLRDIEKIDDLDEYELVRLQNGIVMKGAEDSGFRKEPNYVGENLGVTRQLIHFIAPRPEDVPSLMNGWRLCVQRMADAQVAPIVQAACAAFGFVFIHPFTDGNGRIHRLLIHWVLARAGFSPRGLIFPVSATILKRRGEYDKALEHFSGPLMRLIQYDELEDGRIEIRNETAGYYRFVDCTHLAEALGRWTEETIKVELKEELDFMVSYRDARRAINEVADLPDREINSFIKIVLNNRGRMSSTKRPMFSRLSDDQVAAMVGAIKSAFRIS